MDSDLRIPTAVEGYFNIISTSHAKHARLLSNFAHTPFHLMEGARAQHFSSMEGFIQGIKFAPGEDVRTCAFQATGPEAKAFSALSTTGYVYWDGNIIPRRSKSHFALIEKALRAKFAENAECVQALLATRGLTLLHKTGEPESKLTSLPARKFCEMLTKIREDFLRYEPKSIDTPRHARATP
jgi:predicted NAD-dependent protein-ADP-ribosyltransferase YbiA (DUF1768 family)